MRDPDYIFRITIGAHKSDVPVWHALKRLLKAFLRTYGFRCMKLEQLKPLGQAAEEVEHVADAAGGIGDR